MDNNLLGSLVDSVQNVIPDLLHEDKNTLLQLLGPLVSEAVQNPAVLVCTPIAHLPHLAD